MALLSSDWKVNALLLLSLVVLWIYFKVKSIYRYFEDRNIPYIEPTFLLGSDVRGILGKDQIGLVFDRMYQKMKHEKTVGCFLGIESILVVNDPEYVNRLLTTNFEHFIDRPFLIDEKVNPLEEHLFFIKGNKWKFLRNKLSPVFTSGKLKYMYDEMYKCADVLVEHIDKLADGKDLDLKEILAKFATDVIGSTAFGLEPECLHNPDSEFRAMGRRFFAPTFRNSITFALRFAAPKLLLALNIRTTEKAISDYFISLINRVFEYRLKNSVSRKDFVQLSLQLKEKGSVDLDVNDVEEKENSQINYTNVETIEITNNLLAAQSFVFFLAGFETTSTTMHFLIYLLSANKDCQDRLRKEVKSVKEKYGSFTYDSLKDLTYLDNCIAETLRLFPPVTNLNRECTKDYTFADGTIIEKGRQLVVPVLSLHHDEKYFKDPESFVPERFDMPIIKGTYLPFGDGPRICIGKRFAYVQMKMTVAKLIDKYNFEKSHLTKTPIEFEAALTLTPKYPLWVKITKSK